AAFPRRVQLRQAGRTGGAGARGERAPYSLAGGGGSADRGHLCAGGGTAVLDLRRPARPERTAGVRLPGRRRIGDAGVRTRRGSQPRPRGRGRRVTSRPRSAGTFQLRDPAWVGRAIDRAAHRRNDADWLEAAWRRSRVVVVDGNHALVAGDPPTL